jgi:hypothetical protein
MWPEVFADVGINFVPNFFIAIFFGGLDDFLEIVRGHLKSSLMAPLTDRLWLCNSLAK